MEFRGQRSGIGGIGGAARLALLACAVAAGLAGCGRGRPPAANATGSELKVVVGAPGKLDPDSPLRCFVKGQFVGMQTPAQCAAKNGVAPGALDVGLDASGALAAAGGDTTLQPIGNALGNDTGQAALGGGSEELAAGGPAEADASATAAPAPSGDYDETVAGVRPAECLRFTHDGWRPASGPTSLNTCVHALFQGRCAPAGEVLYGRWGANTLRLAPGRVEMSGDNRSFHPLAVQDPDDCSIPAV